MAEARRREEWGRTSAVMALVANVNRDPKKTRAFKPGDFDPTARSAKAPEMTGDLSILRRVFVDRRGKA